MAILLDGSAVLAAADRADLNHEGRGRVPPRGRAAPVPALTLGELDECCSSSASSGQPASLAVVDSLVGGEIRLVSPTTADLSRAAGGCWVRPPSIEPRLADAVLVAVAERLGVRRVATFDRRPIAVFRPRHVRTLDLEP